MGAIATGTNMEAAVMGIRVVEATGTDIEAAVMEIRAAGATGMGTETDMGKGMDMVAVLTEIQAVEATETETEMGNRIISIRAFTTARVRDLVQAAGQAPSQVLGRVPHLTHIIRPTPAPLLTTTKTGALIITMHLRKQKRVIQTQ